MNKNQVLLAFDILLSDIFVDKYISMKFLFLLL